MSATTASTSAPAIKNNGSGGQKQKEWPWEMDESKRYPEKDPVRLTAFERQYPPDLPGTELDDNSRLFRVYQGRMNELDGDTLLGWSDTINFLLVFAGLFSAILTAFLLELSKKLEADHAEYSSLSLFVLASNASGRNVTLPDDADPREFKPKTSHRATNVLWFASLTLSLLVSMLAILAKQWIGVFISRMRKPVRHLRRWAHRHRAYRDGLDRWHLNAFVSGLSVLLHVALFLFLVGLVIYTRTLDVAVFITVTVMSGLGVLIYVGTTLAPLFDGTCPTATPLLFHAHNLVVWALARLGWYRDHTLPPYHEDYVLPDRIDANSDAGADAGIFDWILGNLAGEQEVSVALDAVAALPRDAANEALATREAVKSGTLHRLEHLVKGRQLADLETNAAELARTIRSILRSGIAPHDISSAVMLSESVKSVHTHDVAVLSRLLRVDAGVVPMKEMPGLIYDQHVAQLARAFQYWTEHASRRPSIPISRHTCDLLFTSLQNANLPVNFCSSLLFTFCRNPEDSRRWIELTTRNMERELEHGTFVSTSQNWAGNDGWSVRSKPPQSKKVASLSGQYDDHMCRALHAWSSLFMTNRELWSVMNPPSHGIPEQCSTLVLDLWQFGDRGKAPTLPLSVLQTLLAPLNSNTAVTPRAILKGLHLIQAAVSEENAVRQHWNATIGQILCRILEPIHRYIPSLDRIGRWSLHKDLRETLNLILTDVHELIILRICSNSSVSDAVKRSTLNVLTPRIARDRSRTSIWQLLVSFPGDTCELSANAAMLSEQLVVLGMCDWNLDISGMFEQLLGHGHGAKLILGADPSTTHAFDIMRHVASSASERWAELRTELMAEKWSVPSRIGRDALAALVVEAEAEAARPCSKCAAMAQRMLEAHNEAENRVIDDEERLRQDNEAWFERRVGCETG